MKKLHISRKMFLLQILAVLVTFLVLMSPVLYSMDHVSGNNISKMNSTTTPIVQSSNSSEAGYVKYTHLMSKNTMLNDNVVNTGNGLSPFREAFHSSNSQVHVTNFKQGSPGIMSSGNIAKSYAVTFRETGLPSGVRWYINVTGFPSISNPAPECIELVLSNGTYTYTVSTSDHQAIPNIASSSFTVNGCCISISIHFLIAYTVTFTETGLPSGTPWYVNITNHDSGPIIGTSDSLSLTNGTYIYTIGTTNKLYHANEGSFTVNGVTSNNTILVSFSLVTYTVTFIETGLPSGATWYVNITSHDSGPITGTSYSLSLINGTYTYTIGTSDHE
ncbi:hypothetical protein ACNF41_04025, partial [Cuniculiplasmataceae archaeon SKW1]